MTEHDRASRDADGAARSDMCFLCGADMEPELIRQRWPNARFVARARLRATKPFPWYPLTDDVENQEIWGLLLDVPDAEFPASSHVRVTTDDGRELAAALGTGPETISEPVAMLAAARYWELPPAFVRRLQAVAGREPGPAEATGE